MVPVDIYTRDWCGYCSAAKALLERKGVAFNEINTTGSAGPSRRHDHPCEWRHHPAADLHRRPTYRRLRRSLCARTKRQARRAIARSSRPHDRRHRHLGWVPGRIDRAASGIAPGRKPAHDDQADRGGEGGRRRLRSHAGDDQRARRRPRGPILGDRSGGGRRDPRPRCAILRAGWRSGCISGRWRSNHRPTRRRTAPF